MLDRAHRLVDSRLFAGTVRRGRRAGGPALVLHLKTGHPTGPIGDPCNAPRVGFVVSKTVGNAVARNQVKRRLRHLVRDRLALLPDGALLVVRALPTARTLSAAELGAELDRLLDRLLDRSTGGAVTGGAR